MKHKIVVSAILLFVLLVFSACTTGIPNGQNTEVSVNGENGQVTESVNSDNSISKPEFLNDIGKTLSVLKNEQPTGEFIVRLDGFPDAAAACFADRDDEYAWFFFGGQDGDFGKAMNECENQLKCAGFMTTAGVLFPEMEDNITFSDFFSLIDISEYTYSVGEHTWVAEGWLRFTYNDMDVWIDTNEADPDGGRSFTGVEKIRRSAPASIINLEIFDQNQELADAVMFE